MQGISRLQPESGFWIALDRDARVYRDHAGRTRFAARYELVNSIRHSSQDTLPYPHLSADEESGRQILKVQPPDWHQEEYELVYVFESKVKEVALMIRHRRLDLGYGKASG